MFKFNRPNVAIGTFTVKIGGAKTIWGYRRLSTSESIELDNDLREYTAFHQAKLEAFQSSGAKAKLDAMGDDSEEWDDDLIMALSKLQQQPPSNIALPVFAWVTALIVSVEGVSDPDDETKPLVWSTLSQEDKSALVDHIEFNDLLQIIALVRRDSHLSEVELGKSKSRRGKP